MEALGPWHLLIVAAVFVVFFGAKRLPDAAKSLGRSARILKAELKDGHDEPVTKAPVSQPIVPIVPVAEPVADPADVNGVRPAASTRLR